MKLPRTTLAFVILAPIIVFVLSNGYTHRGGDLAGYLTVGELGLTGQDIYRAAPAGTNTWPPLFGLACIPLAALARLSLVGTRWVWLLVNWIALVGVFGALARLVYDRPLALRGIAGPDDGVDLASGAVLLPLLLSSVWVISNFEHLQVNILVFGLTLAGLLAHRAGRDGRAGLWIGLAAALKVMPVLFVPYFAWRRRWRAAAATAAAAVGWSLVPALAYGPAGLADQFAAWREALRAGWGVGKMNLSVYAMTDRIVGHGFIPFALPGVDAVPASGHPAVLWVAGGILLAATLAACLIFRGPYEPRGRAAVAEWGVVLLVAALFGTVTWKAYLVVVLIPMTLFVAAWREAATDPVVRRRLRLVAWASFVASLGSAADIVGRDLFGRLEMGSLQTFNALALLGALLWYRARVAEAPTSAA
ncbi:MAG TPA: glycosyltransferase family 87 protein [Longimicrobiales bacterium]|nr:glycosyltransferase family 87 protein [Longimicrobiales bacterium]